MVLPRALIAGFSMVFVLGACSEEEKAERRENYREFPVWKHQLEVLERAKEVQGEVEEHAERRRREMEEQMRQ